MSSRLGKLVGSKLGLAEICKSAGGMGGSSSEDWFHTSGMVFW